jgi:hypothetical protein
VTQSYFVDFWTQAFTFANLAPAMVILLLDFCDTNRTRVRTHHVLLLGLVGGIVLNCTTPAGSVPFALPLGVIAALSLRVHGSARVAGLLAAFVVALGMYAPSLVELWQEAGRFSAPRRYTMNTDYAGMWSTAALWPVSGYIRSAGFGAPFGAVALCSLIAAVRPGSVSTLPTAWRATAAAAATCLVMYMVPVTLFPIASGNGVWGQLLTVFAIPLAAAQITAWYRQGPRRLQLLTCVIITMQLTLVGYWIVRWWVFQLTKAPEHSVGRVLDQPSELERALVQRVYPNRDRVLLSSSAEGLLLRRLENGHVSSFARSGIPVVNGWFRFVSYQNVYPDVDMTWGTIQTKDESLRPEVLDIAGVRFLVTLDGEIPSDASMRPLGQYPGHGSAVFQVWENLDVWPRMAFVDPALERQGNTETGVIIWRRHLLPSRLPDAVTYDMSHPGRYSIKVEPVQSDRLLLISDVVRTDLLTVKGATLVRSGPLSDVFTVLKIPAGATAIHVTWETPLRRWLWTVSYLTFALSALAYVVSRGWAPFSTASHGR